MLPEQCLRVGLNFGNSNSNLILNDVHCCFSSYTVSLSKHPNRSFSAFACVLNFAQTSGLRSDQCGVSSSEYATKELIVLSEDTKRKNLNKFSEISFFLWHADDEMGSSRSRMKSINSFLNDKHCPFHMNWGEQEPLSKLIRCLKELISEKLCCWRWRIRWKISRELRENLSRGC